jgi:hypothetical protein
MPMPPLTGRTVARPHPAVKPKTPPKPGVSKVVDSKPVMVSVRAVAPAPDSPPPAAEPIVTKAPSKTDFSSLFSESSPEGIGSADVSSSASPKNFRAMPADPEALSKGDSVENSEPAHLGPPLSEMIESLRGPEEAGVTSNATVSDIVKGLSKPAPQPAAAAAPLPTVARVTAPPMRTFNIAAGTALARSLGFVAMLVGVFALCLCVMPRVTRFAVPMGAAGVLIAVFGALVPARRRGTEVALALGGSAVSLTGLALAILVATGVVPSTATANSLSFARHAVSMARSGDIEVRVASATIVRPVFYTDGVKSPQTDSLPILRIALEIRNLANTGSVAYKSWGALRADVEPVILSDDDGNQLKLKDFSPKIPAGRPREFPSTLRARSRGIPDVLLFELPPAAVHELTLQLPGANVQAAGGFNLQIPAAMLRKQ